MNIKPMNISEEEKTRIFEESLKNQTLYVEKEPVKIQPVDRWISCKEQLPEVGQPVLIYYPYWTGLEVQTARLDCDKLTFDICGEFNASVNKVTHWKPLPEPPNE